MPKAFTKQAAASAADSASNAPTAGTMKRRLHSGNRGLTSTDWNVSHSDTNPFSGVNTYGVPDAIGLGQQTIALFTGSINSMLCDSIKAVAL